MKKALVFAAAALFSVSAHAFYSPILATNVEILSDEGRTSESSFFNRFIIQGEVLISRDYPVGTTFTTEVRVFCGLPGFEEPAWEDLIAACEDLKFYAEFQEFLPLFNATLCINPRDEELEVDDLLLAEAYAIPPEDLSWVQACWTE